MKKHAFLVLALLLCLLLGACSAAKPADSASAALTTSSPAPEKPAVAEDAPADPAADSAAPPASEPAEEAEEVEEAPALTADSLAQALLSQPLAVTSTSCETQTEDASLKILYPDMLSAILQNNSGEDIRSAVVAFVAWDENNLPVKIQGQFDFSGGVYVKKVNYDDINLVDGGSFGEGKGYSLSDDSTITTCKAIAVSYETFEGTSWTNPYFEDFCTLYEGKKLS